jgi:hypothetical protein
MKHMTIGIFSDRTNAEKAINQLHNELKVPTDDISYVYRNADGDVQEVDAGSVAADTPAEGAGKGAMVGGAVGALAGIATVAGVIPVVGPLFAAGPLAVALGLTGAVGTTAASAATGAAAGGIIGALANLGVGKEKAQQYADRVGQGDILVAAHTEHDARAVLEGCGAIDTDVYSLAV